MLKIYFITCDVTFTRKHGSQKQFTVKAHPICDETFDMSFSKKSTLKKLVMHVYEKRRVSLKKSSDPKETRRKKKLLKFTNKNYFLTRDSFHLYPKIWIVKIFHSIEISWPCLFLTESLLRFHVSSNYYLGSKTFIRTYMDPILDFCPVLLESFVLNLLCKF